MEKAEDFTERETERTPDGDTTIDILADADELYGPPPPFEDCTDEQEAAIISGEIIVCRRKQDQREFRTTSPSDAQRRYAEETAFANDPQAPDVAGAGIFKGPATASGLCFIPPCPKEAALIIDIESLPEAPPGSDADRIARGLPPLGNDRGAPPSQEELGLPPVRPTLTTGAQTRPEPETNPEESEEPEEQP
ncbi:hypothetical protein HUO12_11460 [Altererythrobacter sp. JGD-16]|uniref:Uncharacterized protein n=1 Tax=Altererythrobacter lutimaris TaxID=2743979 RepID=A0A850H8P2_9SPHN|nr:hypothetical protein [Altererythrobacter lutimaris]NVE95517.1 hypothetical protein [Altererythrobacter lutimaris]